MAIAKCDGGLQVSNNVSKSTLRVMQTDSDALTDEGAKSGLESMGHGSTIILAIKSRLRSADAITIGDVSYLYF